MLTPNLFVQPYRPPSVNRSPTQWQTSTAGGGIVGATATAVPPHILAREEVKTYIRRVFSVEERRLEAMMSVVDNAQVEKRHAIFLVDYIVQRRSLTQTTREYETHDVALGRAAAERCLKRAGVAACEVDLLITV